MIDTEDVVVNNNNNIDKTIEAHLTQLEIFYDTDVNGNRVYYVKESTLFSLGVRNVATDPNSSDLIPVKITYLDRVIRLYEMTNPSMSVEKLFVPLEMKLNQNNSIDKNNMRDMKDIDDNIINYENDDYSKSIK